MRLTCLGGAGEIGANSYHLEVGDLGLVLDAGMHPKKRGPEALPRLEAIAGAEVDHILVTHAHLDHVGALPRVMRSHVRARIHMTAAAWRFASRMLRNSVNVMRRQWELDPSLEPPYGFGELDDLDLLVETHAFDEPFDLGRGVRAVFVPAGHIPGAAGLVIDEGSRGGRGGSGSPGANAAGGRRLFYTGDTCAAPQLLLPGARYPEGPIDVLLTEATYGGNPLADSIRLRDVLHDLGIAVARVLDRGGVVLLPVFALGRAQELLFALWVLMRKGRVPRVPMYLTGLARAVAHLYDVTRAETPRSDPELRLEKLGFAMLERDEIQAGLPEGPAVVLASSGMVLPETASSALARRLLPRPEDAIFIVGYQDPDSPGYRIQHSHEGDLIDLGDGGRPVERRCAVGRFHFRAHSSRAELLGAARRMRPRRIVLVHGDPASGRSLGETLTDGGADVVYPEAAQAIEI